MVQCNNWPAIDEMFVSEFEFIDDTFYNPPMVEPIKPIRSNKSCGYLTFNEPVILGKHTQHDDNQNYEALDALNEIPWVIDQDVLLEPEVPPKKLKTTDSIKNFIQQVSQAQRLYKMLGTESFRLGWQYCTRGRIYSHGYHVNLQSYEYKKVMLSFDHYEVATT